MDNNTDNDKLQAIKGLRMRMENRFDEIFGELNETHPGLEDWKYGKMADRKADHDAIYQGLLEECADTVYGLDEDALKSLSYDELGWLKGEEAFCFSQMLSAICEGDLEALLEYMRHETQDELLKDWKCDEWEEWGCDECGKKVSDKEMCSICMEDIESEASKILEWDSDTYREIESAWLEKYSREYFDVEGAEEGRELTEEEFYKILKQHEDFLERHWSVLKPLERKRQEEREKEWEKRREEWERGKEERMKAHKERQRQARLRKKKRMEKIQLLYQGGIVRNRKEAKAIMKGPKKAKTEALRRAREVIIERHNAKVELLCEAGIAPNKKEAEAIMKGPKKAKEEALRRAREVFGEIQNARAELLCETGIAPNKKEAKTILYGPRKEKEEALRRAREVLIERQKAQ